LNFKILKFFLVNTNILQAFVKVARDNKMRHRIKTLSKKNVIALERLRLPISLRLMITIVGLSLPTMMR
jgi:hypothetical protein